MVALVAISYQWLDRPIAFFAHAELHGVAAFLWLTRISEWLSVACGMAFLAVGFHAMSGRPLSMIEVVVALSGVSVAITAVMKDELKLAFGRTWP